MGAAQRRRAGTPGSSAAAPAAGVVGPVVMTADDTAALRRAIEAVEGAQRAGELAVLEAKAAVIRAVEQQRAVVLVLASKYPAFRVGCNFRYDEDARAWVRVTS